MRIRIDRVALIAEMARQNLTCMDLVKRSGVSRVTVSSVRSGKTVSEETAKKLAAGLGVSVADIVQKGG